MNINIYAEICILIPYIFLCHPTVATRAGYLFIAHCCHQVYTCAGYLFIAHCCHQVYFVFICLAKFAQFKCLRPYHVESTSSRPITEVKQH